VEISVRVDGAADRKALRGRWDVEDRGAARVFYGLDPLGEARL
jgi:hypothetical protein